MYALCVDSVGYLGLLCYSLCLQLKGDLWRKGQIGEREKNVRKGQIRKGRKMGREAGREGGREGGRNEWRKGEKWDEVGRKGGRNEWRKGENGRKRGREGGTNGER